MARPIAFAVNGAPVSFVLDENTALLHVLRNDLGLKGTRFGCGEGGCGACAVHVDGRSVLSCDTPLWAVDRKAVTMLADLAQQGAPKYEQCQRNTKVDPLAASES